LAQTPTNTSSPNYSIHFLNPSGHSEEISSKADRSGGESENEYHLVAWVNDVPPNATVEFSYVDGNGDEVTIGTANQTSIPDTFELYWSPPGEEADRANFTMHAVLFSGGTEVARDTESDFTLNNGSPNPPNPAPMNPAQEAQAETIEITKPAMGGQLGFFTPRDGDTNAVIEVSFSAAAATINVLYTVSRPGTEPAWTSCGSQSAAAAADGVRCTISPNHVASNITAIAATVSGSSGDAHRFVPYEQTPTTLTALPAQQNEIAPNTCSGPITATLTDQNGEPIADANLDVHAIGPTDALKFDSSGAEAADTGHGEETAVDCSTADPANDTPPEAAGSQADHNDTGADRKHVESVPGTNDAGQWSFALFSPDRGPVQATVWSDIDNDDVHCSSEVNADVSIGFQEPAPPVTGVPEETSDCPSPSPSSPGPSPSESSPEPTPTDDPRGCTVFGTESAEQLDGTSGADVICAYGGNDVIRGLGGNDVIYGDGGNDTVRGGAGNDEIFGAAGRDSLRGDEGDDSLDGGAQNDVVTGGSGNDRILGRNGFDTMRGSAGSDRIFGADGDDILAGGGGPDRLVAGRGRDIVRGGPGRDRCDGGPGADDITGCER
jgi:hypothetical protein